MIKIKSTSCHFQEFCKKLVKTKLKSKESVDNFEKKISTKETSPISEKVQHNILLTSATIELNDPLSFIILFRRLVKEQAKN